MNFLESLSQLNIPRPFMEACAKAFTVIVEGVYMPNGQPERLDSTGYMRIHKSGLIHTPHLYSTLPSLCNRLDKMTAEEYRDYMNKREHANKSTANSPVDQHLVTREQALQWLHKAKENVELFKMRDRSKINVLKSTPTMLVDFAPGNDSGTLTYYNIYMIKPAEFTGRTTGYDPEWSIDPRTRANNRYRRWKRAELDLPYAKAFKEMRANNPSDYEYNKGSDGSDYLNYVNYALDRSVRDAGTFCDKPTDLDRWVAEKRKSGEPVGIRKYEDQMESVASPDTRVLIEAKDTKMEKAIKEACKIAGVKDEGDLSDGNHTFNDLYNQRCVLFAALVNLFPKISWKTKKHDDGKPCFGGKNFLVCIETPKGPYSYHYPMKDWDRFKCKEIEKAKPFDGHTDKDVERLLSLIPENLPRSILGEIWNRRGDKSMSNYQKPAPLVESVKYVKGHKNSKGEEAPWTIVSHETGKILSSHKTENEAKKHLQQMEYYKHKG